jgi:hypothetical protein
MRYLKSKVVYTIISVVVLSSIQLSAFAEGGGNGCDPFNPQDCPAPLDTYVYIIAIIAIIYTFHHLQKQKKSLAVK